MYQEINIYRNDIKYARYLAYKGKVVTCMYNLSQYAFLSPLDIVPTKDYITYQYKKYEIKKIPLPAHRFWNELFEVTNYYTLIPTIINHLRNGKVIISDKQELFKLVINSVNNTWRVAIKHKPSVVYYFNNYVIETLLTIDKEEINVSDTYSLL